MSWEKREIRFSDGVRIAPPNSPRRHVIRNSDTAWRRGWGHFQWVRALIAHSLSSCLLICSSYIDEAYSLHGSLSTLRDSAIFKWLRVNFEAVVFEGEIRQWWSSLLAGFMNIERPARCLHSIWLIYYIAVWTISFWKINELSWYHHYYKFVLGTTNPTCMHCRK
jgi:hypothetical protein